MTDVRAASLAKQRFLTTLLLVFAATGLALAVVGVYGVLAQLAERRTREMGIRIALGARATDVRWLIVRHGLSLILVGLAAGLIAAVFTTRALRTLLYQVAPVDVVTFIAVAALLTLTGLIALWIPATEASRADPASVLRAE
jgi:ABC-type antimicrobial peptide transport system permease subunit